MRNSLSCVWIWATIYIVNFSYYLNLSYCFRLWILVNPSEKIKGWVSDKLLNQKTQLLLPPQTPFCFWIIFRADIFRQLSCSSGLSKPLLQMADLPKIFFFLTLSWCSFYFFITTKNLNIFILGFFLLLFLLLRLCLFCFFFFLYTCLL